MHEWRVPQQAGREPGRLGARRTSPGSPSSGYCAARTRSTPTAGCRPAQPRAHRRARRALRFGPPVPHRALGGVRCPRATSWRRGSTRNSTPASPRSAARRRATTPLYFHRLALFHEDMHGEAFAWLRATLGYAGAGRRRAAGARRGARDRGAGGAGCASAGRASPPRLRLRQRAARRMPVPWRLRDRRAPVTARPVPALRRGRRLRRAGLLARRCRPMARGAMRAAIPRAGAAHSRRLADALVRPLAAARPDAPVDPRQRLGGRGLCRWAGRRLPSAAEWEHAAAAQTRASPGATASGSGPPSAFAPYPGFVAGPYRRLLRGRGSATIASCAAAPSPPTRACTTRAIATSSSPDRSDVFAGFRTAAPSTRPSLHRKRSMKRRLRPLLAALALACSASPRGLPAHRAEPACCASRPFPTRRRPSCSASSSRSATT